MEDNFIRGQKALERLLSDVKNKTVSHAYILEGPKGVGKKTAADTFARALHCTGENKPCGVCRSCAMHSAGTHPDIEVIEPEDNGNIKIDAVRAAADELYMRPKLAEKKLLIIDGADGMNPAAQNAMLKTFEEPPSYGVVVLLSENIQNLLPTIRSRGVKLLMEPFPAEKIKAFVERTYPAMRGKSEFVAGYSGGIVGKAVEICEDEEFFSLRTQMFEAVSTLAGGKEGIFTAAEVFGVGKKKTDWDYRSS
ncbi:MAG: ATP-binding protein, partial [Clostridia bacterium]